MGLAWVAIDPLKKIEQVPGGPGDNGVRGDRGDVTISPADDISRIEGGINESGASVPREEEGQVKC